MLITFEGPDGSGKTTQVALLEQKLKEAGFDCIHLREPGGTKIGEQIRNVLHSLDNKEMAPTTEALLYQAARAQLVAEVIAPALARAGSKTVILLDRFRDSSEIYQGVARGLGIEEIRRLNDFSTGGLMPDLTILLDIDPERGLQRRKADNVEWNRMDDLALEFHTMVRNGFLSIAREDKTDRWVIVDGSKTKDEVNRKVWRAVEQRIIHREALERLDIARIER